VSHDRKIKKDAYYLYKANWSEHPVLHITQARFLDRKEELTPIKVYCNTGESELIVNGVSMGKSLANSMKIAIWNNIKLREGENTIVVSSGEHESCCVWNYSRIKN
jgi:beta-galactosidase